MTPEKPLPLKPTSPTKMKPHFDDHDDADDGAADDGAADDGHATITEYLIAPAKPETRAKLASRPIIELIAAKLEEFFQDKIRRMIRDIQRGGPDAPDPTLTLEDFFNWDGIAAPRLTNPKRSSIISPASGAGFGPRFRLARSRGSYSPHGGEPDPPQQSRSMLLEGKRPALNWLQDVADRTEALCREPAFLERFRTMLRAWRAEDGSVLLLPVRVSTLAEKYAALAAIHDELNEGTKIDPWAGHDRLFDLSQRPPTPNLSKHDSAFDTVVGPDDRVDPDFASSIAYDFLREDVEELNDYCHERIEALLHVVEKDLADAGQARAKPRAVRRRGSKWLSPKQSNAYLTYLDLGTYAAVARELGISRAAATKLIRAAERHNREHETMGTTGETPQNSPEFLAKLRLAAAQTPLQPPLQPPLQRKEAAKRKSGPQQPVDTPSTTRTPPTPRRAARPNKVPVTARQAAASIRPRTGK